MMEITKPAIDTKITLSASFEDGVLAVTTTHAPPIDLRTSLACALTKDEAQRLSAALAEWASK